MKCLTRLLVVLIQTVNTLVVPMRLMERSVGKTPHATGRAATALITLAAVPRRQRVNVIFTQTPPMATLVDSIKTRESVRDERVPTQDHPTDGA